MAYNIKLTQLVKYCNDNKLEIDSFVYDVNSHTNTVITKNIVGDTVVLYYKGSQWLVLTIINHLYYVV